MNDPNRNEPPGPLSPESTARLLAVFDQLVAEQRDGGPRCGARTVFWPDVEACEAECILPQDHEGTIHEDETLGPWDEADVKLAERGW